MSFQSDFALDNLDYRCVIYVTTYSTRQAAAKARIHRVTLQNWVSQGKVRPSEQIGMNGGKHWRWTEADVRKIIRYKEQHFGQGRGRRTDLERTGRNKVGTKKG